jgi:hypothetical protein
MSIRWIVGGILLMVLFVIAIPLLYAQQYTLGVNFSPWAIVAFTLVGGSFGHLAWWLWRGFLKRKQRG